MSKTSTSVLTRRLGIAVTATTILVLASVPFFFEPFRVTQFTQVLVVAIAVMGLNFLTGFTGQVSVGHSAFFGIAAYTTAILADTLGLSAPVCIILAVIVSAVVGAVVGLPSVRIKGTPLAIVTLVLAASLPSVVNMFSGVTGGTQGIRIERLSSPFEILADDQFRYLTVLVVLVAVAAGISAVSVRRPGRRIRALGDNELAAVAFGVPPLLTRAVVFTVSAAITGLAGSLFVVTNGFVASSTSYVTILGSILFLTALVVGGRAIFFGPLIGAAIVELIPTEIGRSAPELSMLLYGVILIAVLFFAPGGVTALSTSRALASVVGRMRQRPTSTTPESRTIAPTIEREPLRKESQR